tara:strand:- start:264 stop:896 length:633 start_codon:yes stop_codon:yes gene_type:complete
MIYMIKKLFIILLLLNSCALIENKVTYDVISNLVFGIPDIPIDSNFIQEKSSSFIKIKVGRSSVAIMTLSQIRGDIFVWVGANKERIETRYGRVISATGLGHNMEILNIANIQPIEFGETDLVIRLQDPEAIAEVKLFTSEEGQEKLLLDKPYLTNKYKVLFSTRSFEWSGSSYYWLDTRSDLPFLPIKSVTVIHPRISPVEIEFYYKFL